MIHSDHCEIFEIHIASVIAVPSLHTKPLVWLWSPTSVASVCDAMLRTGGGRLARPESAQPPARAQSQARHGWRLTGHCTDHRRRVNTQWTISCVVIMCYYVSVCVRSHLSDVFIRKCCLWCEAEEDRVTHPAPNLHPVPIFPEWQQLNIASGASKFGQTSAIDKYKRNRILSLHLFSYNKREILLLLYKFEKKAAVSSISSGF